MDPRLVSKPKSILQVFFGDDAFPDPMSAPARQYARLGSKFKADDVSMLPEHKIVFNYNKDYEAQFIADEAHKKAAAKKSKSKVVYSDWWRSQQPNVTTIFQRRPITDNGRNHADV